MSDLVIHGLFRHLSFHNVDETRRHLTEALSAEGFRIFAIFDHAAAAQEVGLELPPTQVLVFGNPKGGTPLMLMAPTLAIDLPSRILIRQEAHGRSEVYFNTLAALAQRHHLQGKNQEVMAFDKKIISLIRSSLA